MMRASILDPPQPSNPMQDMMLFLQESTLSTVVPSIFGGYIMGCAFSLFGSLFAAEATTQNIGAKDYFRYTARSAHKLGYNFAYFGLIWTGIEVALEKRRGKKDIWNATVAGGLLFGYHGYRSYRFPGLLSGAASGAAFSIVIETLMDKMGFGSK